MSNRYQVTIRGRRGLGIYEEASGPDAIEVTQACANKHRRVHGEEPTEWTCTRLNDGAEDGRRTWSGR
jgi:hypothetical protein